MKKLILLSSVLFFFLFSLYSFSIEKKGERIRVNFDDLELSLDYFHPSFFSSFISYGEFDRYGLVKKLNDPYSSSSFNLIVSSYKKEIKTEGLALTYDSFSIFSFTGERKALGIVENIKYFTYGAFFVFDKKKNTSLTPDYLYSSLYPAHYVFASFNSSFFSLKTILSSLSSLSFQVFIEGEAKYKLLYVSLKEGTTFPFLKGRDEWRREVKIRIYKDSSSLEFVSKFGASPRYDMEYQKRESLVRVKARFDAFSLISEYGLSINEKGERKKVETFTVESALFKFGYTSSSGYFFQLSSSFYSFGFSDGSYYTKFEIPFSLPSSSISLFISSKPEVKVNYLLLF